MKTLALLILLASADNNLLRNGDFSMGISHWEGDCHTQEAGAMDLGVANTSSSPGVIIKLRHTAWTQMKQDFESKAGECDLTITYSLSPDLKFSTKQDDYNNIPGKVGYTLLRPFSVDTGEWVLILIDLGADSFSYSSIPPKLDSGVQQFTRHVNIGSDAKKGFYLVFPPGDGVLTIHSISLVPRTGQ